MGERGCSWKSVAAPTLDDLENMAEEAFAALPSRFKNLCAGLVIRVEDFPPDDVLEEMDCESDYELLGLFRGQGLAQGGHLSHTGDEPNMVWLYRRPILDYWADAEDTLFAIVTHVLVHEIGHHIGLSDEDMESIEAGIR